MNNCVRRAEWRRASAAVLAVMLLTAGVAGVAWPAAAQLPSMPIVAEPGMVKGPDTAAVTIVEFSDYQ